MAHDSTQRKNGWRLRRCFSCITGISILTLMAMCAEPVQAGGKGQTVEPDYTKGEVLLDKKKAGKRYISLGPIGVEANIWATGWATGTLTAKTRLLQIRRN